MEIFGFELSRARSGPLTLGLSQGSVQNSTDLITHLPTWRNNWLGAIRESFTGAWQRSIVVDRQQVLTFSTVFACMTLIAADIAKISIRLIERDDATGIWTETERAAFSPVLRKPNRFSTRVKFIEHWILSKLQGNAYILKERDRRGLVVALYVLDPSRVQVLVAPDGSVFYQLNTDWLSGIAAATVTVPASEIIHDVCVPLFHPLIGVSPIFACGLAAMHGLQIQNQTAKSFAKGSQVAGVLTAPAMISNDTAKRIQEHWDANYMGEDSAGKVAVLGDGLHFEPMVQTAVNAQLMEQLKWDAEQVCAVFHVPLYMVGLGPAPPYTDLQSLLLQYYTQALQNPIENLELLLDEGLSLPSTLGIELDVNGLARMDPKTQMEIAVAGVGAGIDAPNEARATFGKKPVAGGDTPYMQQQNWPLKQLAERTTPIPAPTPPTPDPVTPAARGSRAARERAAIVAFTARAQAMGLPVPDLSEQAA